MAYNWLNPEPITPPKFATWRDAHKAKHAHLIASGYGISIAAFCCYRAITDIHKFVVCNGRTGTPIEGATTMPEAEAVKSTFDSHEQRALNDGYRPFGVTPYIIVEIGA